MLKHFRSNWQLLLIVSLAVLLRVVLISENPPSLNWDEVSHGYNAYSILKSGKDEWGNFFPTIFRAYGDYKLPVYIYLTSLSVGAFGLNTFAVRLPSVLAGIVTVIFTYLLAKELFVEKSKYLALFASLLVAVSPWTLFLSRGAFEANLALTFIIAGVYFFLKGLKIPKYYLLSAAFLGLSIWTYNSARIFVPILMVLILWLYKKELFSVLRGNLKLTSCILLLTSFLFIPMFWQLLNPIGQARYDWVGIIDEGAIAEINDLRNTSELNPLLARATNNKLTYFVPKFVKNWISHYSPPYLYLEGGNHYQFSIPGYGLLFLVNAPFLLIGLYQLTKTRSKSSLLVLGWFLVGPIASSLTREAPHTLRSITMLPMPMVITVIGLASTINWLKDKKMAISIRSLLLVYILALALLSVNYLKEYYGNYRADYSWSWQYGYRETVDYVRNSYDSYDNIIVTKKYGEPHEFFLFYWPWNPKDFRSDPNLIRFEQSNWFWVDRFDKFNFVNDWQINEDGSGNYTFNLESKTSVDCSRLMENCLLITSPENVPNGWNKLKTINFLDGKSAFEIYEN